MILAALERVACPSCDAALSPGDPFDAVHGDVLYGVVRCDCSEYPIVDGILRLKTGAGAAEILHLVKRGERDGALGLSLSDGGQRLLGRARWIAAQPVWGPLAARLVSALAVRQADGERRRFTRDAPLWRILGSSDFENYLRHRFSADSFWPALATLPLLRQRNGFLLDVGCGIGHAAYLVAEMLRPHTLFSVDQNFWSLFLARRYMSPSANFVALDVNGALPFRDGAFDGVLGLDMFHYVDGRAAFAREIERVLAPDGLVAMLHVHNALQANVAAGRPLAPGAWLRLFRRIPFRAFSEPRLVDDLMSEDRLDLSRAHTAEELGAAAAIELFGSRDETLFRVYEHVREDVFRGAAKLRINPIYRQVSHNGSIVLERTVPSERFRKEYPHTERYLPPRLEIDGLCSEADLPRFGEERPEVVRDLLLRLVLLPLPERYV